MDTQYVKNGDTLEFHIILNDTSGIHSCSLHVLLDSVTQAGYDSVSGDEYIFRFYYEGDTLAYYFTGIDGSYLGNHARYPDSGWYVWRNPTGINRFPERTFIDRIPSLTTGILRIRFGLAKEGYVNIQVYDLTGRCVETIVNRRMGRGYYNITRSFYSHPDGVYFVKMRVGEISRMERIIKLR